MIDTSNFTTTFTTEYCEEIFYNSLCNGLDYVQEYGVRLIHSDFEYNMSKVKLTDPCYEDVLMQMLRDGYELYFVDYDNGDESLNVTITLETVRERVNKIPDWVKACIIDERDDATTADVVIQTVAYGEVIFG